MTSQISFPCFSTVPEFQPALIKFLPCRSLKRCNKKKAWRLWQMKVTVCRFATLLPVTISLPFSIFPGEDEALEDFLAKDWEEELKRHKTSMAETRKLVRDVMQKDWGRGEVVHPKKAKELILQVAIPFSIQLFNLVTFSENTCIYSHIFHIYLTFCHIFCIFRAYVKFDLVPS